jgi:hypothetical protein
MTRRILIALPIALVVGLAFSVQSAMAIRVGDPGGAAVATSSAPIVSEKTAGLTQVTQSAPIVSEKLAGLTQVTEPSASPVLPSEITTGLVQPLSHSTQPVAVSTNDDGFNWSDAGIGAAALFGTMLLGAAGALTLRRHRGTLAH